MHYSKDDIIRMVEEEDVDFIRLQFTDTFGNLKNMAVTSNQLELVLDNRYTFDGAAINGFDTENVDELILVPDLDTFAIFPWRPQRGRVARFICDVMNPDGSPFMADSRFILSQVAKEAKEMGYTFNVSPESEFFLFDTDENGEPTTHTRKKADFRHQPRIWEKSPAVTLSSLYPRWDLKWSLLIIQTKKHSIVLILSLMTASSPRTII